MRNSKTMFIGISLLLIIMLTACGNTKKLTLTSENIQKVFNNTFNVGIYSISDQNESISAIFNAKQNIPKSKAKEELTQVEGTLHKNFTISNSNSIDIEVKGRTLIQDDYGKIQIGQIPEINISVPIIYLNDYSMSTKFNLLSPVENSKITATDPEDGDLTSKIKLKNSNVLTEIGTHTLIYEVTDSNGNTVTNNELTITVKK